MKQQTKISLFETRDFGGNFDTSLAFIKQNYLTICKAVCFFIPFALIGALVMPSPMEMQSRQTAISSFDDLMGMYGVDTWLAYLFIGLGSLAVCVYTISYMAEYVDSVDGKVETSAIWSRFTKVIFPVFVCQIVYIICVSIGTILCIVPGIFIGVACMFYSYVYIIEGETIIGSLKRSYELVKDSWWISLAFGFTVAILVGIMGSILSVPLTFATIAQMFGIEALSGDIYITITSIIAYVGQLFLSPLTYMAMGIFYFSLRNKNEAIDMESEINNLGTNNTQY